MFELLSAPIRKFVRDKRWESLRPIQVAAIKHITSSDKNIILASRTASGKTEAAFLPILSVLNYKASGVKVLYISPLIALINDQFDRVEELCHDLELPVTKWHGEAKKSLKDHLVKQPDGVVLITPESIEAMFSNTPNKVKQLFSRLQFLVIDEIHSFIGTDRGVQLNSLLSRLNDISLNPNGFRTIGLSATIGDFSQAKLMTGKPESTVVLRDTSAKEMITEFNYFQAKGAELPAELLDELYEKIKDQKVLIFPNSRGLAEEVAVQLKKRSERLKGHSHYFSHHSSIDRELREYIENFAKTNKRFPFAIACTSTLELGIDIGSVETVVQIDAAHSISSLIQRIGRSGRQDSQQSQLLFYATDPWSLLQSLACMDLYREGFIEPVAIAERPYDILAHQLLSIVKESSGSTYQQLEIRLLGNYAFKHISPQEISEIVAQLIQDAQLEKIGNEIIIGIQGEHTVNTKDFYSVFRSDPSFKVVHKDKTIGELPLMSTVQPDENLLLAAKIWKITEVDTRSKKIFVIPAKDGKRPIFFGTGGEVDPKIRERMLGLLQDELSSAELEEKSIETIRQLHQVFKYFRIADIQTDRPLIIKHNEAQLYTFQGTRINRSLQFLLKLAKIDCDYNERQSCLVLQADLAGTKAQLQKALDQMPNIDIALEQALIETPALIGFSKWGSLLPMTFQIKLLKERHFDFLGMESFLETICIIEHNGTV